MNESPDIPLSLPSNLYIVEALEEWFVIKSPHDSNPAFTLYASADKARANIDHHANSHQDICPLNFWHECARFATLTPAQEYRKRMSVAMGRTRISIDNNGVITPLDD